MLIDITNKNILMQEKISKREKLSYTLADGSSELFWSPIVSLNCHIFYFFSSTTEPISTKLKTN